MTSLATIVFKSGIAVEVPMGAMQAQALLDGFDESWDEEGPQIALPVTDSSSGCRLIASEIAGILVTADPGGEEDGDEEEEEEEEEDEEEDDEDEDDGAADERDELTEDEDDLADAEAGKVA